MPHNALKNKIHNRLINKLSGKLLLKNATQDLCKSNEFISPFPNLNTNLKRVNIIHQEALRIPMNRILILTGEKANSRNSHFNFMNILA